MTLQEHYNAIKSGKGNKAQFLKQARSLFPQYFNQYSDFDTATNVLKSKQIISEAAGGVISKGFDIWDWKKILAEETENLPKKGDKYENVEVKIDNEGTTAKKNVTIVSVYPKDKSVIVRTEDGGDAIVSFEDLTKSKTISESVKSVEKETTKQVLDAQAHSFNNKDMKNADNVNFNEIMKGFYCEMKDEKNKDKTGDELKAMVVKNLAKDALHYTKDGMFGEKGVGYTTEAPGLGEPKEPKGKHKSSGYGDIEKEVKVKANIQDSLGDKEAKDSMPKKVKEMSVTPQNSPGVKKMPMPGKEKKIKLKESVEEAVYQGPAVGGGGEGGGERKKPRVLALNKADIDKINNYKPGSIRLLTKDKKTSMYVSDLFKTALDQMERGRSSYEKESKKSELAKLIADVFPPMVRGKIKKELNPKLDPGLKMHYIGINLQPKKDGTGYWIMLVGDFDPLVTESKLRSLIRNIIKEEINENTSDKDIQTKYNEMFSKNPNTKFSDVAKALNVPESQVQAALAKASIHGMPFQESKLRSVIRSIIKEELNK